MSATELDGIIAAFFPRAAAVNATRFGKGHINETYRIRINNGEVYLLQKINTSVFPDANAIMENMDIVATHLQQKKYSNVLQPIQTTDGQLLHLDRIKSPWRIIPFIENTTTHEVVQTPEQAYEAALSFGAFTAALSDLDASKLHFTIRDFHNGVHRWQQLALAMANAPNKRLEECTNSIHFLKKHQQLFQEIASLKLPIRVVHNDTKINNVLFDKEGKKAVAVIDWDTIMPGIIISDFGDLVRTAANAGAEDEADLSKVYIRKPIIEALTRAYKKHWKEY